MLGLRLPGGLGPTRRGGQQCAPPPSPLPSQQTHGQCGVERLGPRGPPPGRAVPLGWQRAPVPGRWIWRGQQGWPPREQRAAATLAPRSGNRRTSRSELQPLGLLPAPHLRVCLLLDTDRTGACITTRAHRHACFSHSLWWAPHSLRAINPASAFIWYQCLLVAKGGILQLLIKSSLSQPPRALPTLPAKS